MSTTFTHSLEPPDPSDFLGTLTIAQLVCGLLTHLGCSLGLIIYIIYKKLYKLAFYKILIVNLIVNFFIWLNTWPGYRLLLFPGGIDLLKGLITLFPWSLTFFRFMFNPFLIIQFFLTFGTNLNSILVLRSKLQYLKYATRCFWGYMAFTVVVSFAPSLTILNFFGGHSAEVMLVNHTLTEVVNREVIKKHVFTSMVSSFVYFLLSLSSTIYIVMALKNQSRNASSHSNAKKLNPWKVFVFQCILHFSVFLWSLVSYALFDDPLFSKYRLECLMLVSDITTVLPPYAYAIIDRNIRVPLMKKLHPKKVSTVYVYAVPAQQTASALVVVRPSAARSSSSVSPI